MGEINLWQGAFRGKVGQLVGAKWKNKNTVRTHAVPSNPNTVDQQRVRGGFKYFSTAFSKFCPDLIGLCALDLKGMSIRNALMKLNKDLISQNDADFAKARLARGSLPMVNNLAKTGGTATLDFTISWTGHPSGIVSDKALIVVVAVSSDFEKGAIGYVEQNAGMVSIPWKYADPGTPYIKAYLLDFRGSYKVSSNSVNI